MKSQKEILQERFSKEYERYYQVELFKRRGYVRKRCESCGKHFWTLKEEKKRCDDQPCSPYSFIGDPPTTKKLDYVPAWRSVERFFVNNGHASIKRYPVVSRWRPDLYFTVASIIDFQRIEGGKVVFELPANPLVVPQMCLRFNDIPSVGASGKHYTSFCMVGQTALANAEGYWKDRCIDLDFDLVTKELGIDEEELSFVESVWVGYGAFGYSLEYFVRGLELGNAVFTAFEGDTSSYSEMKEKVVDMGAGLERLSWITQGTPTAYDSTFSGVLRRMKSVYDVEYDHDLFLRYSRLAGTMNVDEFTRLSQTRREIAGLLNVDPSVMARKLAPLEALYSVADHARTLLFAVADGLLPSNVGGGYNLRVLFRRAQSFIKQYGFGFDLLDVVGWHVDELSGMFPELEGHRDDVSKVLRVEESRYSSSLQRISNVIGSLALSKKELGAGELLKLYESDGITPEQLAEGGVKVAVPEDFYQLVVSRHLEQRAEKEARKFDVSGLPATRLLYYEDSELFEFEARVLRTYDGGYVALDQTAFYARGGGQEPDHGTIDGRRVIDVEKYGSITLHRLEGRLPEGGSVVKGEVEEGRRRKIKRIHTATHILNGASRQVIGPWVWQHSAFKEEDYGRLDVTHFSHLSEEEVRRIEAVANGIVMRNLPVTVTSMQRKEAEERYGFRLFQGGVVPSRVLRIVNIADWDIEACGGTHVKTTGEVGFIKVVKTERIQDGVERLEFVAGYPALNYVQEIESTLTETASILGTQRENVTKVISSLKDSLEESERREKALRERLISVTVPTLLASSAPLNGVRLYLAGEEDLGEELTISEGQNSVAADPSLVYLSVTTRHASGRVVCFVGVKARESGVSADVVVREVSKLLGGSGGGSKEFAQGGGPKAERVGEARSAAQSIVSALVRG